MKATIDTIMSAHPVIAEKPALPWLLDGRVVEKLEAVKITCAFQPADENINPAPWRAHANRIFAAHNQFLEIMPGASGN